VAKLLKYFRFFLDVGATHLKIYADLFTTKISPLRG